MSLLIVAWFEEDQVWDWWLDCAGLRKLSTYIGCRINCQSISGDV